MAIEHSHRLLGKTTAGHSVYINGDERSRHMLAIGKSGGGKSKLLAHCIQQDILDPRRPGLLLIDPHGELYQDIVNFCAFVGVNRRVHLFDPSIPDTTPCYNPLATTVGEPEAVARIMVDGFAQVFKEESITTPMVRESLIAVIYALIANRQTIAEAHYLMKLEDVHGVREFLTHDFGQNYVIKEKWDSFRDLASKARTQPEFVKQFSPADRRLFELNLGSRVREIFGQVENSLDLAGAMREGEIVLVNLSGEGNELPESDARLIGTLMLRDVYACAKARNREYGKAHPFYVYVDECYDYLTSDVEKMLDQTRKFGVHLILACQRISQLEKVGPEILSGVMGGTETKIVFGGLSANDAIDMAREIYMCELELERGVELTRNRSVVGHHWETVHNVSYSTAHSYSDGTTSQVGESVFVPEDDDPTGYTMQTSMGMSSSDTTTEGHADSYVQQLVPDLERTYSATWPIDKLVWEKAAFLKGQPMRHAVVYVHSRGSYAIETPFVGTPPNRQESSLTQSWLSATQAKSGICLPRAEAQRLIQDRQAQLKALAHEHVYPPEPESYAE